MRRVIAAAVSVMFAAVVVWPVLDNRFRLDELLLLYTLANHGAVDLLLTPHGGHSLITSNVAYVVLQGLFGPDSRSWYPVVVATHLVNVVLLYSIVRVYTRRNLLACLCACVWGAAPVHHETLGWFAVYGHVLVVTWVLSVLLDVARIANGPRALSTVTIIRWGLLFLLAATSFGVGLGIAVASGGAILLLLSNSHDGRRAGRMLSALVVIVPLLYAGQQVLYAAVSGRPVLSGARETFTMTGLKVSMPQTVELLGCMVDLASYGTASLAFGPLLAYRRPSSFVGPLAGISLPTVMYANRWAAVALLGLVLIAARWAPPARRRTVAGFGLLIGSAYGVVAVWWMLAARTSLQSLLGLPVGCAAVPRYHYAATALLAVILALSADQLVKQRPRLQRPLLTALSVLLIAVTPLYVSAFRSLDDLAPAVWYERVLANIQGVAEAQPPGTVVYIENRPFRVWMSEYKDMTLPGWAGIFVVGNPTNSVSGRPVRFCERDEDLLRAVRRQPGTRMAELLVAPGEVPASAGGCAPEPPIRQRPKDGAPGVSGGRGDDSQGRRGL